MGEGAQVEPLNASAAVRVTKTEKDALRLVSSFDEVSESSLLRDHTIDAIVARADAIREMRGKLPVEAA